MFLAIIKERVAFRGRVIKVFEEVLRIVLDKISERARKSLKRKNSLMSCFSTGMTMMMTMMIGINSKMRARSI